MKFFFLLGSPLLIKLQYLEIQYFVKRINYVGMIPINNLLFFVRLNHYSRNMFKLLSSLQYSIVLFDRYVLTNFLCYSIQWVKTSWKDSTYPYFDLINFQKMGNKFYLSTESNICSESLSFFLSSAFCFSFSRFSRIFCQAPCVHNQWFPSFFLTAQMFL